MTCCEQYDGSSYTDRYGYRRCRKCHVILPPITAIDMDTNRKVTVGK